MVEWETVRQIVEGIVSASTSILFLTYGVGIGFKIVALLTSSI